MNYAQARLAHAKNRLEYACRMVNEGDESMRTYWRAVAEHQCYTVNRLNRSNRNEA